MHHWRRLTVLFAWAATVLTGATAQAAEGHWRFTGYTLAPPQAELDASDRAERARGRASERRITGAYQAAESGAGTVELFFKNDDVDRRVYISDASAIHPAVIRDEFTGRKALFVNSNYTDRIVGMSERESETILQMLFEHVNTPDFHVTHRWQPGHVAVWEQRVTQHRGVAGFRGPRKLRRLTYLGGRPVR